MTAAATVAILLAALAGHTMFWVGMVNRGHALGVGRRAVLAINFICLAGVTLIPLAYMYWLWHGGEVIPRSLARADLMGAAHVYLLWALGALAVTACVWMARRWAPAPGAAVACQVIDSTNFAADLGRWPAAGFKASVLRHVPGNQLFQLEVNEKQIELARLPAGLAGLSILHLSDFHFSGRIERSYFHEVVRRANALRPDLIAVTGDLCDKAPYIDWVHEIFSPLAAPLGKFFVLGNHDLRTHDLPRLRRAMAAAGFVDVASMPARFGVRGASVMVAGNERPWVRSPDPISRPAAQRAGGPGEPFKILLAHTPDQVGWARQRGFDLMLAGHTHGGQVCFPLIGPLLCPSLYGVRYADGIFYKPPTLMHVSRGISSLFPLRLSCPCEMTKIVLQPTGVAVPPGAKQA